LELDDVTASAEAPRKPDRASGPNGGSPPPPEPTVVARIYPEYDAFSSAQAETESARLRNRLRALAIRFESCDRTLGQALLASHRGICAEAGAQEVMARIAALEAQRASEGAKGARGKSGGDGILGGLLGAKRSDIRRAPTGGTEGDLKVPEPIERELVELARAVASDPRIAALPDETIRASLVKRAELAIEGADLEGRLRFLRRRAVPSTIEHPRAAGEFRSAQDPPSTGSPSAPRPAASSSSSLNAAHELLPQLTERIDTLERNLDQHFGALSRTLAEIARSLPPAGDTTASVLGDTGPDTEARHAAILARLASLEDEIGRRLSAVDVAQRTLTEELTDAFTRHEEAQLRILERDDELRAGRLEVANAQLAAENGRKQAAEAELEVVRANHAAHMDEEQMRMRVDAARHAQTMREQEDAHARAIEQAAEEARIHAAEQTRTREARTAEIERMARLRSRAESAATSRRLREARERRRNTVVWTSVLSGLLLLVFGLLWASGLLDAASQYLRSRASSAPRLTPLESPASLPAPASPANPPTRTRPTR